MLTIWLRVHAGLVSPTSSACLRWVCVGDSGIGDDLSLVPSGVHAAG